MKVGKFCIKCRIKGKICFCLKLILQGMAFSDTRFGCILHTCILWSSPLLPSYVSARTTQETWFYGWMDGLWIKTKNTAYQALVLVWLGCGNIWNFLEVRGGGVKKPIFLIVDITENDCLGIEKVYIGTYILVNFDHLWSPAIICDHG